MIQRGLRHRAPVLWLLIPLVVGLIAARVGVLGWRVPWLIGCALSCVLGAAVFHRTSWAWASLFCASGVFGGAAFYLLTQHRLARWDGLPPREMRLTVRVDRMFAPHPGSPRANGLGTIVETETRFADLLGQRVFFSISRLPAGMTLPIRTEGLAMSGVLAVVPRDAAPATFDGYLVNAGVNFRVARIHAPQIAYPPTPYARFCEQTRRRFAAILGRGLDNQAPLVAIYRGMLLGESHDLTDDQERWFRETGTMHLFAIAGLHIAAIAVALRMLLGLFRLRPWPHLLATIAVLWFYVDVIGRTPSAVRAFAMVALLEIAHVIRRSVNPVATMMFAALIVLLLSPMQLFSASFQMSYGIVSALLLLGLPLAGRWQELWTPFRDLPKVTWNWRHHVLAWAYRTLAGMLGIGLATSLVSAFAGVLYFKLLTPGALIANLILIPAASLVLWSGFLSLLCGLVGLTALSVVFNHSAALTLLGMQTCIRLLVTVPGVYIPAEFRDLTFGFISLGGFLTLLFVGYSLQWRKHCGSYWGPFVWVTLALAIGAKF